ncbi:alpha/beta fold hydrolase [Candidatus Woesearchaeota archaeon]|nr:alpha/beta fold hydrolase [Candidatus Woesearchaeota archaeon]
MEIKNKKIRIKYNKYILSIDYFIRKGRKITLLYLHGLGCSKKDFEEALVISELKDYKIVSFDFPGCGDSEYPKNLSLGMDDLVEITELVVSKLKLSNLIIIGHSMGGLTSLLYAEKYKKRVLGFINVEGNLAPEDCFFSRKVIGYSFEEFKAKIFRNIKRIVNKKRNIGFQKYSKHLLKINQRAYFDYCHTMTYYSDKGNLIERFLSLKIPKFFVFGSENNKLSYIPYLKKKGCKTLEIPNSNHWPGYDNPKAYYNVIHNFVKNVIKRVQ